jgi:hypothetical protein
MHRNRFVGIATGCALLALGCHTLTEQSPSTPTPVSLVPLQIPVIGTPTPAPTPAPTPTPTTSPSPTPTPTPTPTPPPSSSSCNLPPSNPANPQCARQSSSFLSQVELAIDRVTQAHPELFDFKDAKCTNCYFVKDINTYTAQVVKELGRQGLCAVWDGEEVGVKATNSANDQYDIITSSGYIRRGEGAYRSTCRPAVF